MNDRLFLTKDELKTLTGTANREKQAQCLRSNRVPFTLDILGRPVVTISSITGNLKKAEPEKQAWRGPSFLNRAA